MELEAERAHKTSCDDENVRVVLFKDVVARATNFYMTLGKHPKMYKKVAYRSASAAHNAHT